MTDNTRYVIAFGLIGTHEDNFNTDINFLEETLTRRKVASEIEGLILGFCLENGIFKPYSDTHRNPYTFELHRLNLHEGIDKLVIPERFQDIPQEFLTSVNTYRQEVAKHTNQKGLLGRLTARSKKLKRYMQAYQLWEPVQMIGVTGSTEQINRLDEHVKYRFQVGLNAFDPEICTIAQTKY